MGKWESWWETQDKGERGQRSGKEERKPGVWRTDSEIGIYTTFEGPGTQEHCGQENWSQKASHQVPLPAALSPPWETVRSAP